MSHWSAEVTRRNLLQTTALGAAAAATGLINAPALLRAQGAPVKLGVLHPVSGALSYSGSMIPARESCTWWVPNRASPCRAC